MHSARQFVILVSLLLGLGMAPDMPQAFAQDAVEIPPLPRPRPDRDANTEAPPAEVNAATEAIAALADVPQALTLSARITQDGAGAVELNAKLEAGLPANVVRVPAGLAETAALGALFGTLTVSKA